MNYMGACVVARAESATPTIAMLKITKNRISTIISIGTQRARPYSARQSIFLIKEILFDYLIASVAQKLSDLAKIEVNAKIFKSVRGDQ